MDIAEDLLLDGGDGKHVAEHGGEFGAEVVVHLLHRIAHPHLIQRVPAWILETPHDDVEELGHRLGIDLGQREMLQGRQVVVEELGHVERNRDAFLVETLVCQNEDDGELGPGEVCAVWRDALLPDSAIKQEETQLVDDDGHLRGYDESATI